MAVRAAKDAVAEIDINRVMQMIPHRRPFLMIDRVVDLVSDVSEPFFQGHFPGRPVMPGVLIIEAMAQTAAVLVVHTLGPGSEGKLVYFMSVDSCRFRRPVFPGNTLYVHVTKLRKRGNVWKFSAQAKVDGSLVADAIFTAMILDD